MNTSIMHSVSRALAAVSAALFLWAAVPSTPSRISEPDCCLFYSVSPSDAPGRRHAAGDWGDICEEDKKTNEESLDERNPRRVMSVYKLSGERVLWVITEWNREATTVLMPDEY